MNIKYPDNIDTIPKRRRDKDNPYKIFSVGIDTDHPRFFVSFADGTGEEKCLEIDSTLFDTFNRFELSDLSFLNEVDNHYEHSELTEGTLNERAVHRPLNVEEITMQHLRNEMLHSAIAQLPEVQRRRLMLYYFENLTYKQIAELEGCKHPAIIKSIKAAINNLKKYFSE